MANIDKLVVTWSGIAGGTGYSVFYATPGAGVRAHILTFLQAIADQLPAGVNLSVPATGDTIDDATGTLVSSWASGVDTQVIGSANGAFAAPAGACITWDTDGIANGRRVRGRTFLVPLGGTALDTGGTLSGTALNDIRAAATALVDAAAGDFLVWHRPTAGVGGSSHSVVGSRLADKAAVLRSRRD